MKHLMTLAALFVSSLAMAQMPYNPDSNGDNMVGSTDLISFLSFYGNELIQSNLTCDYEGTELEQLIVGAITGVIQIDSVYVEYLIVDTIEYFTPGCPDPVLEPVVLERSYFIYPFYASVDENVLLRGTHLNHVRVFAIGYEAANNQFYIYVEDDEVNVALSFNGGSYAIYNGPYSYELTLPFPESYTINENGIQVDWDPYSWVANCENFRLIPFWSVAE